ncbi:MAG: DUF3320 domain-containing protein [Chitinophagaceae bacterium]
MSISISLTTTPSVNAAQQQHRIPLVRDIRLVNEGATTSEPLILRLQISPEIFLDQSIHIDSLPAGGVWHSGPLPIPLRWEELATLTEGISGNLMAELSTVAGKVLHTSERDIRVLAFDQWQGLSVMPELTAAFITPNHPRVQEVLLRAAALMGSWTGRPVLDEYQTRNPDRVRKQAAAIYQALSEYDITYVSAPPSFEATGQRIRLCDQIFSQGMGNCLDMSLLYASCAEAAGLNPLVVFTRGHAFAGVWLTEETFPDPVLDDPTLLTKRTAAGIHDIVLFEATGMNRGSSATFDASADAADQRMLVPEDFQIFLDVKRARAAQIRPLPLRTLTAEGWVVEEPEPHHTGHERPVDITADARPGERSALGYSRQQVWERRLLDLSLRNSLLSMRITRGLVQLANPQLSDIEDMLANGEELQLLPALPEFEGLAKDGAIWRKMHAADPRSATLQQELQQKRVRCHLPEVDMSRSMTELYRSAKMSIEENGANTLFLVLGVMRWYETASSERPRYAPVLLMPVEILRRSGQKSYAIRSREEDTFANITLLEMLRQDHGVDISALGELPRDGQGVDVRTSLNFFRHAIRTQPRWDVEELAFIGHFSFSKFVMWNDIHQHADRIVENKVVRSLLESRLQWQPPTTAATKESSGPGDILLPIVADGSQMEAIRAAVAGESFILHGPPGTGKSQTITNIIANALYRGKRVLFVAEKMAALEVVQKRLAEIGLGEVCLELHSNKARKTAVLKQLKAMIETPAIPQPPRFEEEAQRIAKLDAELAAYARALHRPGPSGMSVYDCISRYMPHAGEMVDLSFDTAWITGLSAADLNNIHERCEALETVLRLLGDMRNHPLQSLGISTYSQTLREEIAGRLQAIPEGLDRLRQQTGKLMFALGLPVTIRTDEDVDRLTEMAELLASVPEMPIALMRLEGGTDAFVAECLRLVETGRAARQVAAQLSAHFRPEWRALDGNTLYFEWQKAEQQWFLPRYFTRSRILRTLRRLSLHGGPAPEDVPDILRRVDEYRKLASDIERANTVMSRIFGTRWMGVESDWEAYEVIVRSFSSLLRIAAMLLPDIPSMSRWREDVIGQLAEGAPVWTQRYRPVALAAAQTLKELRSIDRELSDRLEFNAAEHLPAGQDWFDRKAVQARNLLDNLGRLRDWCGWMKVRREAEEAGLGPVISLLLKGGVQPDRIHAVVQKNLYRQLANRQMTADPLLSSFNGILFDEQVRRFIELSDAFRASSRRQLVAAIQARKPNLAVQATKTSEVGILQKAILGNGRGLSIRQLFDQIPTLLPALCPCMLMSPISVAQYLRLGSSAFDLVIFDEASQMPTSEAAGAIARGSELIVVGDPKQMPPTNFFSNLSFDEENPDKEDLESILDDCLALSMPSRHLRWHYRSRHESLIAFSNAKYYENRLLTFPSVSEIRSRVRWVSVNGFYDRGRSKHNVEEAKAIVAELRRIVQDPSMAGRSIGIVTFNSVQQKLIQDMVDDAVLFDPRLEQTLLQGQEPLFIKNLENVQGDERDVILFSVGYGKDGEGKLYLNFGPLNREGGWRRLNVAVSRARHEMVVFSTLKPEDIDLGRTSSEGVAGLRAFLEYAHKGRNLLPRPIPKQDTLNHLTIEKEIAQRLQDRGIRLHARVGCSDFRIDIAILHPEQPDTYLLAVLCDGEDFAATREVSDRHLGRRRVLEQLGWRVHQVWTIDWWEDPAGTLDRVEQAYREALQVKRDPIPTPLPTPVMNTDTIPTPLPPISPVETPQETQATGFSYEGQTDYAVTALDAITEAGPDEIMASENRVIIRNQMRSILETEAPVARPLILQRVCTAWSVARRGMRLERHLNNILDELNFTVTLQEGVEVLWLPAQDPELLDIFRTPADDAGRRAPDELPAHEVGAAVRSVVKASFSLPEEELIRELTRLFGFARTGSQVEASMRNGISMARMLGWVKLADGRYSR